MKFAFVILHFNVIKDTVECIDSIIKLRSQNTIDIVVVDNNSPNMSGNKLKEIYMKNKNVHLILNSKNLGFAKGNNVGFEYAKYHIKADFIATINNDTLMIDEYFVDKIVDLYKYEKFHVMGPDIITKNGTHQNPYKAKAAELKEINKFLKNYEIIRKTSKIKVFLRNILFKNNMFLKLYRKFNKDENKIFNYTEPYTDIVLHGAALIFSPLYIKNENFAFFPETFMYLEEDILYHLCMKKNYIIKYSPLTKILHKEDSATDSILKSDYKKQLFILENHRISYEVLKNILS